MLHLTHLQRVEDGEQPGKDDCVLVHSKEAQHPGQPQQGEENEGSLDDGAGRGGEYKITGIIWNMCRSCQKRYICTCVEYVNDQIL